MDSDKLEKTLTACGQPRFRLAQAKKAVFRDGVSAFSEITTLPKELREKLDRETPILSFAAERILAAKDGRSIKALLRLSDGQSIETVLISPKPGDWSACISCQVGCPMGCRFCATGKMGFRRNLSAEEIADQVLFWRQHLRKNRIEGNFSNIVYMGMGEPFLNWENVSESMRWLIDPERFGFGARSLSVSTAGIASGIGRMARESPQANLAISLHFATDEKRLRFMPVNSQDDLAKLRDALREYFSVTNRKVFLEYLMLEGINDSDSDARKLAEYVRSVGKLQLLHVNLIRYNETAEGLRPSSRESVARFKAELEKRNIPVTIRKSLGSEIQGACGQLAGK